MISQIITTGAIFYKLKDFELIHHLGTKSKEFEDWYLAICFKDKKNKKFFLVNFYFGRSSAANDRFFLVKIFNQKPGSSDILKILKSTVPDRTSIFAISPIFLPNKPLPIGEDTDIFFLTILV